MKNLQSKMPTKVYLSPKERELMLAVIGNDLNLKNVVYAWWKRERYIEVMEWLVKNRITGRTLSDYMWHYSGPKIHTFFQHVLQLIDKLEAPPPMLRRDFRF